MQTKNRPRPEKSPPAGGWLVPGLSVALGVLLAVPVALRGDLGLAAALLAVMVGYAVVLVVLSRRFEAADLLRGAAVDERQHSVHVRAASFCGYAMATAAVGGFGYGVLTDHPATTAFALLCFVGGVSYIAAMVYHAVRG